MRIVDGNIFEAMRLVLPEHRELMKRFKQESNKRTPPILPEDAWNELEYVLVEALRQGRTIRVTLFDPDEDVVWEGIPMLKDRQLHLRTADGIRRVPVQKVVKIEAI
ncbi:YolD-like family protein [Effusibacillus pohliae]|uniref:YolD-like family protein n=1 Tax=Effusibacillus pohliae TaxID=232270 RepID=UPI00036C68AD|nr:YolD-like family protein [Effusibacillus pohliae]